MIVNPRFCNNYVPDITTTGNLKVSFLSGKSKLGGAKCEVECVDEITTVIVEPVETTSGLKLNIRCYWCFCQAQFKLATHLSCRPTRILLKEHEINKTWFLSSEYLKSFFKCHLTTQWKISVIQQKLLMDALQLKKTFISRTRQNHI